MTDDNHDLVGGVYPWSFPEASQFVQPPSRSAGDEHGLFLKHHISRVFNRQDAKYAKFPGRCLSAGGNIEFVGLGDLGVWDSNVLVSGLRSRRGASFQLLNLVGTGRFTTVVSVPLVVEYEHALLDAAHRLPYGTGEIRRFIDFLCTVSERRRIHFLWRPLLPDSNDDMVLEAAVAEKISALMTEDYLEARAKRGKRRDFEAVLAKVPDVEADEKDH